MAEDTEWRFLGRDHYMDKIVAGKGTPFVKVLTGIRRCGKSTLLRMFRDHLISSEISEDDILYLNFDEWDDSLPSTDRELMDHINSKIMPGRGRYILLDEVQNIKDWENAVTFLYSSGADVYITGSNSNMLSSELATRLSGRSITIHIAPLSFSEYVKFRKDGLDHDTLFRDYMRDGGLPAIALSEDMPGRELIPQMISGTYETVYAKDVIDRHSIRDPAVLRNLLRFIMRNIGDRTSPKKISSYLTGAGQKTSHVTIENYLEYLEDAHLISRAERIDSKTRDYLQTTDKFYATDLGIRHTIAPYKPDDIDGIMENIVFNELVYRYGDAAVLDVEGTEVDFVVNWNGMPEYFQVCYSLGDKTTLEREMRPFTMIGDNYPKTVITFERYILDDIDGVRIIRLIDWLLESNQ